jgi:hypothetical protein
MIIHKFENFSRMGIATPILTILAVISSVWTIPGQSNFLYGLPWLGENANFETTHNLTQRFQIPKLFACTSTKTSNCPKPQSGVPGCYLFGWFPCCDTRVGCFSPENLDTQVTKHIRKVDLYQKDLEIQPCRRKTSGNIAVASGRFPGSGLLEGW